MFDAGTGTNMQMQNLVVAVAMCRWLVAKHHKQLRGWEVAPAMRQWIFTRKVLVVACWC